MKTILTLGDLREALKDCNDNDYVVIETTDLKTGDADDLFPFCIDVIEDVGGNTVSGETYSEIRFCQQDNKPCKHL